jgi:hypothetical protein
MTRERIHKIEAKALRKLKHAPVTQAAQLPEQLGARRLPNVMRHDRA